MDIVKKIKEYGLNDEQTKEILDFQKKVSLCSNEDLFKYYQTNQYQICADLSFYRPFYIKSDVIKHEAKKRNINLAEHQISLEEAMNAEED